MIDFNDPDILDRGPRGGGAFLLAIAFWSIIVCIVLGVIFLF